MAAVAHRLRTAAVALSARAENFVIKKSLSF
jgi:hypothetical protein